MKKHQIIYSFNVVMPLLFGGLFSRDLVLWVMPRFTAELFQQWRLRGGTICQEIKEAGEVSDLVFWSVSEWASRHKKFRICLCMI